jgi:hypothetical protein
VPREINVLTVIVLPRNSFASGGDSDSLDYIAYVAKDNAGSLYGTKTRSVLI